MADSSATPQLSAAPVKTWTTGTLTYTTAGLVALFCWLLWGDFAVSMKDRTAVPVMQLLLRQYQVSDTLASILVGSLPALVSFIVVPIVGYRSDRHRGRLGRRIPYLLWLTPIAAISMVGLALSPGIGEWLHGWLGTGGQFTARHATFLLLALFWTAFEFASIVMSGSLLGALINDVVPTALLGRFYGLFRAVSLLAGMIFNYWLIGKAEAHYVAVFLCVGTLYGGGFILMCLRVKEGNYPPPPAPKPGLAGGFFTATAGYFRDCFTKPYYLWIFAAVSLTWMSFVPINLFMVFFAKSVDMSMDTYGKIWAFTYCVSLAFSYLIGSLADRFHPLRAGTFIMGLYAVAVLVGGLWTHDARSFAVALFAHGLLSGAWQTVGASLQQRLYPRAKFAQFASACGLVTGVTNVVLPLVVGRMLDLSGHVYRYTFLFSGCLAVLAVLASFILYRKFTALGGEKNYVAPE